VSAGKDESEPAHDREENGDGSEQATLAADRRPVIATRGHAETDPANQNQMRDRQNQPKRRRQPVPIRERRLQTD
jgi:hypothetical protein